MSLPSSRPSAAIIGAGIAGLSSAIALRRAGWQVTLYERSSLKHEIGAALCVNPSATRCLDKWGLDYEKAQSTENMNLIVTKGDDMTTLGTEIYEYLEQRVDLHEELLDLATREEGKGIPATMKLECAANDVDCESGIVRFEYGTEVKQDLVVIANGVHSHLVSCITGGISLAEPSGRSNYRFLLPMDKVMADPELAKLYEDGRTGLRLYLEFKDNLSFINYPCHSNNMLNCAVVHNTRKDQDKSDVWNSESSVAQLKETTRSFHPTLQRFFDLCKGDDVKIHHMMKRNPLSSFVHGRACVLGDAAHVMLPTHGAGAVVTIESAATFEPVLAGVKPCDFDAIQQRLQIWDRLRNGRCNFVMLMSNAGNGGLNNPGVEEEIRRYYNGPLPPKDAGTWTAKSREVFFGCDPFEEGKKALEKSVRT